MSMIHPIARHIEVVDGKPLLELPPKDTTATQLSIQTLDQDMIQPNAFDVRLDRVFEFNEAPIDSGIQNTFSLTADDEKIHALKQELYPLSSNGTFVLRKGNSYEIIFQGTIKMGATEAGWIVPRSSLNRNGIFITSGLYDAGYEGVMAACMHVMGANFTVMRGARLGQFLLFHAETAHRYSGNYGVSSEHDQQLYGS